jgi:hypothetical protein
LGRSKRFWLGDGTIVPVEEADEADEEESFGEVGRRLVTSSSSSSSTSLNVNGLGGGFEMCALAKERRKSLIEGSLVVNLGWWQKKASTSDRTRQTGIVNQFGAEWGCSENGVMVPGSPTGTKVGPRFLPKSLAQFCGRGT